MGDNQVLAAILTVALYSAKPRANSKRMPAKQWRDVLDDYKKFLLELERTDASIDRRGINPD